MDEIFVRELLIFVGIIAIFIGSVPMMLKGHMAASLDSLIEGGRAPRAAADDADDDDDASADAQVRVSRKRKARARESARKLT